MNIQYGVIHEVRSKEIDVKLQQSFHTFSINKDEALLVTEALVEGSRIVAVDVDNNTILFNHTITEANMSHLEGAADEFEGDYL